MRTKLSTLFRAGGALVALLAITIGIPRALARVAGWPLPTTWPHLERLPDVLRDGLSDGFWVKAMALVVWFRVGPGDRRRRCGGRRPGAGPARRTVAGASDGRRPWPASSSGRWPSPAGSSDQHPTPLPRPPRPWLRPWSPWPVSTPTAPPTAAPVTGAAAAVEHLVVPGESLSSIARDELGQAAAWPALWDANQGRVFGERVFDDPNLILPGWDLAVPRPAVLIPPLVLSAADEHVPAGPMPVAPPTPPAPPAPACPPVPTPAPAAPETVPTTVVDSHSAAPAIPATPATPTTPAALADEGGAPAWTQLGVLVGSTLLATGAAGMIASARRRSLRVSATTSTVVAPEPERAEVVTALHAGSDTLAMARLELALRSLGGPAGPPAPRPSRSRSGAGTRCWRSCWTGWPRCPSPGRRAATTGRGTCPRR